MVCICSIVAVVGLTSGTYTGNEEEGYVSVGVGVVEGELQYPITLQLTTVSNTADGMIIITIMSMLLHVCRQGF